MTAPRVRAASCATWARSRGNFSEARGINATGQVAGQSSITGGTAAHAFRYDGTPGSGGVIRDLGTLGGIESHGFDLNDAGQVVGDSDAPGGAGLHAFLYTGTPGAGGQMLDLDGWLNANNPAEGAKWTLATATGISETGWITGNGFYDPDGPGGAAALERAFLLDASGAAVPEPAGIALLGLALPALLHRRRRKRLGLLRDTGEEKF